MAISEPAGAVLAFAACKLGMTPNAVTVLSGLISTLGAVAYVLVPGGVAAGGVAFVVLQLGYVADCSDGQLARAMRRCSPFGAWLDVAVDFLSDITIPVALAVAALHSGTRLSTTIAGCVLLIYGQTLFLHTSTTKRKQGGTVDMKVSGAVFFLRLIADHGMFLALICLTRALFLPAIPLLMVAYGSLYSVLAIRIARNLPAET